MKDCFITYFTNLPSLLNTPLTDVAWPVSLNLPELDFLGSDSPLMSQNRTEPEMVGSAPRARPSILRRISGKIR
jgi:hypothetical protein